MYDFKAILDKEPVAIAAALRSLLFVAVLAGLAIDEKLLSAIALGAEITLALFVRKASTPTAKAEEQVAQAFDAGVVAGQG